MSGSGRPLLSKAHCPWLLPHISPNHWCSISQGSPSPSPPPSITTPGHSWLNAVIMECARYYPQLSHSFKAFVDWWVFVLQQFPGDVSVHSENSVLYRAQVKISIIALIAANFSLNGPCCHISQQAGRGRWGTRISHGPPDRDEREQKWGWNRSTFSRMEGLVI